MWLLTLRDLQHRAVRFALVITGTTIVFALLLLMFGLSNHFVLEPQHAVGSFGASEWLVPEGGSGPFTSAATLDRALADDIEADRVDPIIVTRATFRFRGDQREVVLVGHVDGGIGTPHVAGGRNANRPGEIVLDETAGARPGDLVEIGGDEFAVAGVTRDTTVLAGLPLVFVDYDVARDVVYHGAQIASAIVVKGRAATIPPGLNRLTNAEVIEDLRKPLKQAVASVELIRTLLWIVSAMIIGGVVYLSTMERRRDFAVLKAVGASTRSLMGGLAAQGIGIALGASALASGVQVVLAPAFPLKVEVTTTHLITLPVLAVAVAVLASAAGMRRVARTDPALAFSGPGG